MSDEIYVTGAGCQDKFGKPLTAALTPKPDIEFRARNNPPKQNSQKFVPEKFNYRRVGTAPVPHHNDTHDKASWQHPIYPIHQKPIKMQRDFEVQKSFVNNQRFGAGSAQAGLHHHQPKPSIIPVSKPNKFIGPTARVTAKYPNRVEPVKVTQMFYPQTSHESGEPDSGGGPRRIQQAGGFQNTSAELDKFGVFKGGQAQPYQSSLAAETRQFSIQHHRNAFSQHQQRPTRVVQGKNVVSTGPILFESQRSEKPRIASFKPIVPPHAYQTEQSSKRAIVLLNQQQNQDGILQAQYGQKQLRNRGPTQNVSSGGVPSQNSIIQQTRNQRKIPTEQVQFYQGPPFVQQLVNKYTVPESSGIPVPAQVQKFQMQQKRPPSRQKLPNQAQNLDDDDSGHKNHDGGYSGRLKIVEAGSGTFQRNLQIANQSSSGGNDSKDSVTGDDFASQYAAMSQNAIRPPSRHKDPPQNMGLDLPSDDQLPSLDEDSGSSAEFDLGIACARNSKELNSASKQALLKKYQTAAPFDNSDDGAGLNLLPEPPESDIQFSDDPVIKDFINLSSHGSRGIKTSHQQKRNAHPNGQNSFNVPTGNKSTSFQTQNNFFPGSSHVPVQTVAPTQQPQSVQNMNVNMNVNVNLNVSVNNPAANNAIKALKPVPFHSEFPSKPKSTAMLQHVGPSSTNNKQSRFKGTINQKGTIDALPQGGKIQNKLQRRPPQSANLTNAFNLQRPPQAHGNRSSKPTKNGRFCEMGSDEFRSPLSMTQTKEILGSGACGAGADEDDSLFNAVVITAGAGAGGIQRNLLHGGTGCRSGVGVDMANMEHNFKSQTLQFQTNLGSDFINLFAPSEQGKDDLSYRSDLEDNEDTAAAEAVP